ncbi:nucleotide-binding universal stress UspA family protein [Methanolinea mesophila]|uniref:universal stress protein n=1 Tax=Methanolinea mesophila TaxID=547055 RepID=UPI001AE11450|nr:universal stress protein [Methanolinea mesophila]MBP1927581.1 nucleotide-binding universal stress UspA family protein [Methanolinea mesophila]
MFHTILIAIDGSPITHKVLQVGVDEAKIWRSGMHLIYVIESGWPEGDVARELTIREMEEDSDALLRSIRNEIEANGGVVTIHKKHGHAGEEIVRAAGDLNADLVIVGSVGKSQVKRMLAGSVSTYVVTHSPVTTLVVKP